jgi:outer membrane protein assembly factor BamE
MSGFPRTGQRARGAACSAIVALVSGCSSMHTDGNFLGVLAPYRIDIVQGNVLTKDQIERVRPGMSRLQVRDVLGSPLLTDLFHADRWDYVFTIRRPGTEPQRRAVVVIFEGDKLLRVDAPELPSEREFVAQIGRPPSARGLPVLELTEEQRKALPVPAKAAPKAPPPAPIPGPARSYPPLEPPR